MDPSRFVDQIPDYFTCSICMMVAKNPLEHVDCKDCFCTTCIAPLSDCPVCGNQLYDRVNELHPMLFDMVYKKLKMKCPNEGYDASFLWPSEDDHQQNCEFRTVPCSLCGETMLTTSRFDHEKVCNLISCEITGCGKMIRRDELDAHDIEYCRLHMDSTC